MNTSGLTGLSVLVVEDEPLLRKQIIAHLEHRHGEATGASSVAEARRLLERLDFDLALLDVHLPDGQGTSLLREGKFPTTTAVIVMTADGGVEGAVEAMRLGALDYLVKPFEIEELPLVIERAHRSRQSVRLEEHRRSQRTPPGGEFVFGQSLSELQSRLRKILEADCRLRAQLPPVLIEGETGTGKTTVARWLHDQGPRSHQPLVEMNCSALPDTLAESELFGHERGAFTDARNARMGLFEAAQGGTLFLDELPSLSLGLQAKVLKAVEEHRIRRLGGTKEIPVDVRVVAASNQDLIALVQAGRFREDLYHRLDLYRLHLPPLRERKQDLPDLAKALLQRICRRHRLRARTISAVGTQRLLSYPWPGNVRELAHELERAVVFDESATLDFKNLHDPARASTHAAEDWFTPGYVFPEGGFDLEQAIQRLIHQALDQTQGNVSAAARLLGVTRDYVRYRLASKIEPSTSGE